MKIMPTDRRFVLAICTWQLAGLLVGPSSIETAGVGETLLRSEDRDLAMESHKDAPPDGLFRDSSDTIGPIRDELGQILAKVNIQVVAPNKELSRMMTTMSTKTRSMFLVEHAKYSDGLKIHTTTRPMLLSYLGLYYATDGQVTDWYARHKARLHEKVICGCEAFLKLRLEAERRLSVGDLEVLKTIKQMTNKLPFVKAKFENNLNLFMIDNYLMLCSRLEPGQLREKIDKLHVRV